MGNYLKLFETHSEYETYAQSGDMIKPNVSYCEDNNEVHYNPWVEPPFFCKLTLENGETVELEGNGELTQAMVSDQYALTLVSAEIGSLCTTIGENAFYYCGGLTTITIGSNVTSIGEGAFYNCIELASIVIDSSNTVYDSRDNCNAIIETATNTLLLGCSTTVIPNSVTTIGINAFGDCYYLANIIIPNSVTTIDSSAFDSCRNLTSVIIPNSVTSIGNSAFQDCSNLTSVTIGSGITHIGNTAFHACRKLTSVTIDATTPPTLGANNVFDYTNNCPIYVPSASVNAYKAAEYWSKYADRIQAMS